MNLIIYSSIIILICISCGHLIEPIGPSDWKLQYENRDNIRYYAIHFADENNGWIVGSSGTIKRTIDGGDTWHVVKHNSLGGSQLTAFNENKIYFLNLKLLFRTFDGGLTWDSLTIATPKNYNNYEISFPNPNYGYITTVNGTGGMIISDFPIMMTKNGGSTWQVSEFLSTENFGISCIYFVDGNTGWIAGGSRIFKTDNGGEKWMLDYSSISGTIGAKDIYFINVNCGWLINYDGQIYKYKI
jgi:photosystem II stability/assembly factor-like uncharacterized protein